MTTNLKEGHNAALSNPTTSNCQVPSRFVPTKFKMDHLCLHSNTITHSDPQLHHNASTSDTVLSSSSISTISGGNPIGNPIGNPSGNHIGNPSGNGLSLICSSHTHLNLNEKDQYIVDPAKMLSIAVLAQPVVSPDNKDRAAN